MDSLRRY